MHISFTNEILNVTGALPIRKDCTQNACVAHEVFPIPVLLLGGFYEMIFLL
jgi:hypothetical protein